MALVDIELRAVDGEMRMGITYDDATSRRYLTNIWAELLVAGTLTVVVWTTEDGANPGRTQSGTLVGPGTRNQPIPTGQQARIGATYEPATGKLRGVDFETFWAKA
jgi:hypothetical protein